MWWLITFFEPFIFQNFCNFYPLQRIEHHVQISDDNNKASKEAIQIDEFAGMTTVKWKGQHMQKNLNLNLPY
jgi:hypothetical protein